MIEKAIGKAYRTAEKKQWNKIYWAIDLHDTCLKSTYGKNNYEFLGPVVIEALRLICSRPENVLIIWSAVFADEEPLIVEFFAKEGIRIDFFNHNPVIQNTATGNFDTKFYFNVLVDDKAGFDWTQDWQKIIDLYEYAGTSFRHQVNSK